MNTSKLSLMRETVMAISKNTMNIKVFYGENSRWRNLPPVWNSPMYVDTAPCIRFEEEPSHKCYYSTIVRENAFVKVTEVTKRFGVIVDVKWHIAGHKYKIHWPPKI
jgi:hypothetical protein